MFIEKFRQVSNQEVNDQIDLEKLISRYKTGDTRRTVNKLFLLIEGYHLLQLKTSKSSALTRGSRPCYEGKDYGDQEYLKLVQVLEESFQDCRVSPFYH